VTTIALDMDLREIAADSQDTDESGQKYQCKKLFTVNNHIIATAGGSYAGLLFVEWFDQWTDEPEWSDRPDLVNLDVEEDFECIVIRPDGSYYTVNRLFIPYEQEQNRQIAIGSGGKAARAAMMAGCSPTKAVKIAKKIDTYTGGKVVSLQLPDPEEPQP
jgi:hypothetical protein